METKKIKKDENLKHKEAIDKLLNSSLLSGQHISPSTNYEGVVICETDSDRIIYNTVANKISANHNYLFIHAHNKQTIKDIANLLKDTTIPYTTIVDIDILNTCSDLENLLESFLVEKENIEMLISDCRKLYTLINDGSEDKLIESLKEDISELLIQVDNDEHNFTCFRSAISRIYTSSSKWQEVKKYGIDGIESNETKTLINKIVKESQKKGIYIVPVGELSSWIPLGITRKNKWIIPALEQLNNDKCLDSLKEFVESVLGYLSCRK